MRVEKLLGTVDDEYSIDKVLLIGDGDSLKIGTPLLKGATVKARIVSHGLGEKVTSFKLRRRKNSKRRRGHRQGYTEIEIVGISVA